MVCIFGVEIDAASGAFLFAESVGKGCAGIWGMWRLHWKNHVSQVKVLILLVAGPIVRIAPNEYSIDDLEALKIIYGHGTQFAKASPNSPLLSPFPTPN